MTATELKLPYGDGYLPIAVPTEHLLGIVRPQAATNGNRAEQDSA